MMNSTLKFLWIGLGALLVLIITLLSFWKIPAPSVEIHKEIKLKRPLQ